jgi:hypothetical protein
MSEELNIVIPNSALEHIDALNITESDLLCMYDSIRSSKELRYYAKAHGMDWEGVKEKFTSGRCLLCVENNQMYKEKTINHRKAANKCLFCSWRIFEGLKCNNYQDHDEAIERYGKWLVMLFKLLHGA